ncbi:phytosulfokines 3-like [Telopea speciosissima]|uniref:phytosulfokines 3-like n=1 Tax=Telopea speciosissima TaxID=54955 RepID=UPI001CC65B0F|nr:phytosulfokines 3-like [Telopea speciosissima]
MSKVTITTLFLVSLLLCASLTCNARPEPAALPNDSSVKTKHADSKAKKAEEIESCDGIGEDECLMRRSLNAHTDYIYTQDVNP